ncbi:hypothetical protein CEXT_556871 [Caerostris extrusa]|uniref:Uncharacterized protein n=1 Tax=Caerostris extrusa TaxID=172846 RepID=A0AAV4XRF6_CAEEX|nr:hypothetical protein CEXT_556871 [Caerostris extrusa]
MLGVYEIHLSSYPQIQTNWKSDFIAHLSGSYIVICRFTGQTSFLQYCCGYEHLSNRISSQFVQKWCIILPCVYLTTSFSTVPVKSHLRSSNSFKTMTTLKPIPSSAYS